MQFVLVHGTFSGNRTWGIFAAELERLDPTVGLKYWPWTGANAQGGRVEAARKLASYLNDQKEASPDQPLVLVGHSHGGNVCRAAASLADPGAVQAIVYIATPHLLFARRRARALAYLIYGMLAFSVSATLAGCTLAAAPLAGLLGARIGGTAGLIVAYAACTILLAASFLAAGRALSVKRLERTHYVRSAIQALLALRRSAIRRNCFAARSIPELNITTKRDEAYYYLRFLQTASWAYQMINKIYFALMGVMCFVAAFLMGVLALIMAVFTLSYVGESMRDSTAFEWPAASDVLGYALSIVAVPLSLTFMLLLVMWIYWLFYGGPWNYGIKLIFDLFFLNLSAERSLPGQTVLIVSIPLWTRICRMTLMHFDIHREPVTAHAALEWAKEAVQI